MQKGFCRIAEAAASLGNRRVRPPRCLAGEGAVEALPRLLAENGAKRPMVVASPRQCARGDFAAVLDGLGQYVLISPEGATLACARTVAAQYRAAGCDSLVAVGGGSVLEAAKAAAALVTWPDGKPGIPVPHRAYPVFIAVPTTAGAGAEATMAAVVADEGRRRCALGTRRMAPCWAILDPVLTASMPCSLTACTGLDALTHAVEAYLSPFGHTAAVGALAEDAAADILHYLPVACRSGDDLHARERLLKASFKAGCAGARAGMGNVHAIAHALTDAYDLPHALTCAVILPTVLEDYGGAVERKLARLAEAAGLPGRGGQELVEMLLEINRRLGIPAGFACIREEDLPALARAACREANPAYPVPVIYDRQRCMAVIARLCLP